VHGDLPSFTPITGISSVVLVSAFTENHGLPVDENVLCILRCDVASDKVGYRRLLVYLLGFVCGEIETRDVVIGDIRG
jgi:hypothetical protein